MRRAGYRVSGSRSPGDGVAGLAGCGLGQPNSFAGRSEKVCASATRTLAKETPVTDPVAYTIDRFTELDRILVTVSTDTGFPGGAAGQTLRTGWVLPARASLRVGRPSLNTLRVAVVAKSRSRVADFAVAARIGETGVKTTVLEQADCRVCAALFLHPLRDFGDDDPHLPTHSSLSRA